MELFAGTESFSSVAKKRGHSTFTVELDPSFAPDLVADVMRLSPDDLPDADFIWASPPCTSFSVASIGHHWGGGKGGYIPKTEGAKLGKALVQKTIALIEAKDPTYWIIENPRGLLRKMPFMEKFQRFTVWYCRYGDGRAKPTDLWVSPSIAAAWTPRPPCKNGGSDHASAPRGARTGTQGIKGAKDRSRIPPALFHEIFDSIERL